MSEEDSADMRISRLEEEVKLLRGFVHKLFGPNFVEYCQTAAKNNAKIKRNENIDPIGEDNPSLFLEDPISNNSNAYEEEQEEDPEQDESNLVISSVVSAATTDVSGENDHNQEEEVEHDQNQYTDYIDHFDFEEEDAIPFDVDMELDVKPAISGRLQPSDQISWQSFVSATGNSDGPTSPSTSQSSSSSSQSQPMPIENQKIHKKYNDTTIVKMELIEDGKKQVTSASDRKRRAERSAAKRAKDNLKDDTDDDDDSGSEHGFRKAKAEPESESSCDDFAESEDEDEKEWKPLPKTKKIVPISKVQVKKRGRPPKYNPPVTNNIQQIAPITRTRRFSVKTRMLILTLPYLINGAYFKFITFGAKKKSQPQIDTQMVARAKCVMCQVEKGAVIVVEELIHFDVAFVQHFKKFHPAKYLAYLGNKKRIDEATMRLRNALLKYGGDHTNKTIRVLVDQLKRVAIAKPQLSPAVQQFIQKREGEIEISPISMD